MAIVFKVEMMVIGGVGIEIGASGFNGYFPQQASLGKLMQGVVDGRQRDRNPRRRCFLVQHFCADMTVVTTEHHLGERNALTRRTQACIA